MRDSPEAVAAKSRHEEALLAVKVIQMACVLKITRPWLDPGMKPAMDELFAARDAVFQHTGVYPPPYIPKQ